MKNLKSVLIVFGALCFAACEKPVVSVEPGCFDVAKISAFIERENARDKPVFVSLEEDVSSELSRAELSEEAKLVRAKGILPTDTLVQIPAAVNNKIPVSDRKTFLRAVINLAVGHAETVWVNHFQDVLKNASSLFTQENGPGVKTSDLLVGMFYFKFIPGIFEGGRGFFTVSLGPHCGDAECLENFFLEYSDNEVLEALSCVLKSEDAALASALKKSGVAIDGINDIFSRLASSVADLSATEEETLRPDGAPLTKKVLNDVMIKKNIPNIVDDLRPYLNTFYVKTLSGEEDLAALSKKSAYAVIKNGRKNIDRDIEYALQRLVLE